MNFLLKTSWIIQRFFSLTLKLLPKREVEDHTRVEIKFYEEKVLWFFLLLTFGDLHDILLAVWLEMA